MESFLPEGYKKAKSAPTYRSKPGRSGRTRIDWDTYLYRCSSLPKYFVTTKEYSQQLFHLFNEEVNGFERVVETDDMLYGTEHEQDSIDKVNRIRGTSYTKIKRGKRNKYIQGTPDIKTQNSIIDIKTPKQSTFDTITRAKALRDYKWQIVGYCWLYGKSEAEIIYVSRKTEKIKCVKFAVTDEDIEILRLEVEQWRKLCWSWWKAHISTPWEIPF